VERVHEWRALKAKNPPTASCRGRAQEAGWMVLGPTPLAV
jgi:hypothetical protein